MESSVSYRAVTFYCTNWTSNGFKAGNNYSGTLYIAYKSSEALYFSIYFTTYRGEGVLVGYNNGTWTFLDNFADLSTIVSYEEVTYNNDYTTGFQARGYLDNLRVMLYRNGLKRLKGLFKVTTTVPQSTVLFTIPNAYKCSYARGADQLPWVILFGLDLKFYCCLMPSATCAPWGMSVPVGTYMMDYWYA